MSDAATGPVDTPFDEAEAAAALGFPGEPFRSISPYGLDLYWIVIGSGAKAIGRPVIVKDGHVVSDKGYAIGMAWLRQLAGREYADRDAEVVPQVLRWYDALPLGWNENHRGDPQTNERGSVKLHPIEVKLVSASYIRPRSRSWIFVTQPGGPPHEPPPSSPPGGGPPGGWAPAHPCRATLLDVGGKLTWVVETFDPHTKTWSEQLREPAED